MFLLIAAIGLGLNSLIIWMLNEKFLTLDFYLAKLIAIGVVFFWNFLMNNFFNFKQ